MSGLLCSTLLSVMTVKSQLILYCSFSTIVYSSYVCWGATCWRSCFRRHTDWWTTSLMILCQLKYFVRAIVKHLTTDAGLFIQQFYTYCIQWFLFIVEEYTFWLGQPDFGWTIKFLPFGKRDILVLDRYLSFLYLHLVDVYFVESHLFGWVFFNMLTMSASVFVSIWWADIHWSTFMECYHYFSCLWQSDVLQATQFASPSFQGR